MRTILSKTLILIFFSFLLTHFSFIASPAFAQTKTTQPVAPISANTNPDVPNNLHNWTQNVMIEVMSSLTCQLTGIDPINPKQPCLGIDQKTNKIGFLPSTGGGGAIGFMGNMISVLYTPPLHTSDYFQNLAQNFGITKNTYAQQTQAKTGFQGLSPLLPLWSAFRNIVYLIFVIVFVIIGLAIMLRVKIDPRTVMTIQNQIPKIIIGILLVTFSYAIAGFLVDMMWVSIHLAYGVIAGIPGVNLTDFNPVNMQGKTALDVAQDLGRSNEIGGSGIPDTFHRGISGITDTAALAIKNVVQDTLGIQYNWKNFFNPLALGFDIFQAAGKGSITDWLIDILSYSAGFATFFTVAHVPNPQLTTPLIGDLFNVGGGITKLGAGAGLALGAFAATEFTLRTLVPYLIAYLIIYIALLTALIRLWFSLLLAYVYILLDVVLAPFWIIGGIVPGSQISFSGWIRDLAANLLAFPATIIMFLIGKVIVEAFGATQVKGEFVPPLIGNPGSQNAVGSFIGIGFILLTPTVVSMMKAALKAPKIDLSGVGKGVMAGAGVVGGTAKSTIGAGATSVMGDPFTKEKGIRGVLGGFARKTFG